MNFARVETAELSDAELENVAGGIGADVDMSDEEALAIEVDMVDEVAAKFRSASVGHVYY